MRCVFAVLALLLGKAAASASDFPAYQFAKRFSQEDLLGSQSSRDAFLSLMFAFEGRFHSDGVGIDMVTGMTFDGTAIDSDTLLPQAPLPLLRCLPIISS